MAEPITEIVETPDDGALLRDWEGLWKTPGQREAIERALDLLRAIDERGLLEGARATIEGGDAAGRALEEFLARSRHLRLARNARVAFELVSSLDLEALLRPPRSTAGGPSPNGSTGRPMGLLELRRRLRDPDVSAGLDTVLAVLAEIGRARRRP
jgi:uncharacterized protein YjgD (DUF1641 family)